MHFGESKFAKNIMIEIYTPNQRFDCKTTSAVFILCSASLIHLCLTCLFAFSSIFLNNKIVKTNYLHILFPLILLLLFGRHTSRWLFVQRTLCTFQRVGSVPFVSMNLDCTIRFVYLKNLGYCNLLIETEYS